jgi:carboxyl-terminal processing protease
MNLFKNNYGFNRSGMIVILALGWGFWAGVMADQAAMGAFHWFGKKLDLQLISEAWDVIQHAYVDRAAIKPQAVTYGAVSGMVDALGDTGHSRFLTPDMVKELSKIQEKTFEGIGAEVRIKDGHAVVAAAMDNSPAQRAGLQTGDIILRVNGAEVTGLPLDQVVARVSGPAGTSVTLTILSPSTGQTYEVTIKRASVKIQDVTWQRLPGTEVAHLRIAAFGRDMASNLRTALSKILRNGLKGVILDLRNNPGGLLDEAVDATSQFLKSGNVLLIKDANGKTKPIPVKSGGMAPNLPLAVLVNSGTASAAEIMAGALSASHRAELIGVTTYGTGTVLSEFALSDGSALLLAVEEWLTPDGRVIWHKGITPNITVELPAHSESLLPEEEKGMTVERFRAAKDSQLLRALESLGL